MTKRNSCLVIMVLAIRCGGASPDLPEGWTAAKSMALTQSECNNSVPSTVPPEAIEVRTWGPPADVAYHNAHFRCAQKLCAYGRIDGDAAAVLVQPCEMDPMSVAKCDCRYEVGLSASGTPAAIEVHRRWDNLNQPNPPLLIGRVVRSETLHDE